MLKRLRDMLASHWEWLRRRAPGDRGVLARIAKKEQNWERSEARARFWAEMRAGQQEAATRSKSQP